MGPQHKLLIFLLAAGVGIAVLIGLAGARGSSDTQVSQSALCSSLASFKGATQDLVGLDPSSASKSDYESAAQNVKTDWDNVATAAKGASGAIMSTLESAWNSFEATVKAVPSSASASDAVTSVQASGQALVSATESTLSGIGCS